jgi:5-methylcytosine-specific restriction protein A
MPQPPLRPCTAPGCPQRTPAGRCSRHAKLAGRQRDTWTHLYGREWPRTRLEYLSRHPACALCPRMASVADHYPAGIRTLRARGVVNPHADHRLRPLCNVCHNRETSKRQPGGWNAR